MLSALIAIGVILGGLLLLDGIRQRRSKQMRDYAQGEDE